MDIAQSEYVLPRLNIAIYGVDSHLLEVSKQLMVDRRFLNSKVNIFGGGISAAINVYKNTITPNVLIIELEGNINQMISQLFELSEVCDSETHVIIAGQQNDVELYRELIRHGISEYFVLPTTATHLISIINNLYKEDNKPLSPSVAFVGAAGGVGNSMLAQSVALAVADYFKLDTIFTDLDTAFATSSLSWSLVSKKHMGLIVESSQGKVDEDLVKSCLLKVVDNLSLLTAPIDPAFYWDENNSEALSDCLTAARILSDFNIIDVPSGQMTIEKRIALMSASEIVIVTEPTIKGIRNLGILYHTIKELRPNDALPKVVLNKVGYDTAINLDDKVIYNNIGIKPDLHVEYVPKVIDLAISRGVPVASISGSKEYNDGVLAIVNSLLGKETKRNEQTYMSKMFTKVNQIIGL